MIKSKGKITNLNINYNIYKKLIKIYLEKNKLLINSSLNLNSKSIKSTNNPSPKISSSSIKSNKLIDYQFNIIKILLISLPHYKKSLLKT